MLKSFSDAKDAERRDFRCSSDNEEGRSRAKCSLLRSRRKANMDEDRDIVSAMELPKNLLMEFQRAGSTGSKSVLLISLDSTSSIHPTYDCVDCSPWTALSNFKNSSMDSVMEDLEAFGKRTSFLKSSLMGAEEEKYGSLYTWKLGRQVRRCEREPWPLSVASTILLSRDSAISRILL